MTTLSDRELLQWAAKAVGIALADPIDSHIPSGGLWIVGIWGWDEVWNPLNDDGDAFRLVITLRLDIEYRRDGRVLAFKTGDCGTESWPSRAESSRENIAANTRRAIVRAAAALGQALHHAQEGE